MGTTEDQETEKQAIHSNPSIGLGSPGEIRTPVEGSKAPHPCPARRPGFKIDLPDGGLYTLGSC